MGIDVSGFKQGQRAMWASGDHRELAQRIDVADTLLAAVAASPGEDLLDVATGRPSTC
jgi:hypothetical protein